MNLINAAVTNCITGVVERLSERYGFASAEALAYLAVVPASAVPTVSVAPKKGGQGRPEKKVKPVVNKGELVEEIIQTLLETEAIPTAPVVVITPPPSVAPLVLTPTTLWKMDQ